MVLTPPRSVALLGPPSTGDRQVRVVYWPGVTTKVSEVGLLLALAHLETQIDEATEHLASVGGSGVLRIRECDWIREHRMGNLGETIEYWDAVLCEFKSTLVDTEFHLGKWSGTSLLLRSPGAACDGLGREVICQEESLGYRTRPSVWVEEQLYTTDGNKVRMVLWSKVSCRSI